MANKLAGGVKAASTSVSIPALLRRVADSTEMTGIVFGGVTCYYTRQGAAPVAITSVALTAATDAYLSGGWFEILSSGIPGLYRFDVPDAAFAAGADWVIISVKVAAAFVYAERFNLETQGAADNFARIGAAGAALTAITGAALSVSDEALLTSLKAMISANQYTAPALALAPTSGSVPTVIQIRQEMDANSTRLAAIVAALPAMFVTATISDAGPTSTVFKGSAGLSAVDGFYVGQFLVFTGNAALAPQSRPVTGYVGATRSFSFGPTTRFSNAVAFVGAPTNGDSFLVAGDVSA